MYWKVNRYKLPCLRSLDTHTHTKNTRATITQPPFPVARSHVGSPAPLPPLVVLVVVVVAVMAVVAVMTMVTVVQRVVHGIQHVGGHLHHRAAHRTRLHVHDRHGRRGVASRRRRCRHSAPQPQQNEPLTATLEVTVTTKMQCHLQTHDGNFKNATHKHRKRPGTQRRRSDKFATLVRAGMGAVGCGCTQERGSGVGVRGIQTKDLSKRGAQTSVRPAVKPVVPGYPGPG